jgi:hypothetical protein
MFDDRKEKNKRRNRKGQEKTQTVYSMITLFLIVLSDLLYFCKTLGVPYFDMIWLDIALVTLSNHIVFILFILHLVRKYDKIRKTAEYFFHAAVFKSFLNSLFRFLLLIWVLKHCYFNTNKWNIQCSILRVRQIF